MLSFLKLLISKTIVYHNVAQFFGDLYFLFIFSLSFHKRVLRFMPNASGLRAREATSY